MVGGSVVVLLGQVQSKVEALQFPQTLEKKKQIISAACLYQFIKLKIRMVPFESDAAYINILISKFQQIFFQAICSIYFYKKGVTSIC